MNAQHIPHKIFRDALGVAEKLEPLKTKKDPVVAAIAAFALGGVGLGAYLQSWVDFFIPWLILLILMIGGIVFGELPLFFAPLFWAFWAIRRVNASNAKLEQLQNGILDVEVIAEPPRSRSVQIPTPNSRQDIEFRLRKLNELFDAGVLTAAERDDKKKEILSEL